MFSVPRYTPHSEETKRKMSLAQKGKPRPWLKGIKRSAESRERYRLSKLGELNPKWVGDKIGYLGLHDWIKRRLPKPKLCISCNVRPPYDLANISGRYLRDLDDWHWLCRRCHMLSDGRMNNLAQYVNQKI
jgi:hypothetical protein